MSAPNISSPTSIYGKSTGLLLTSSWQAGAPVAGTGQVIKINGLYVGNNSTTTYNFVAAINRGGTNYYLCKIYIPPYTMADFLTKPIYLEEGDFLQMYCGAGSTGMYAVTTYEVIS